MDRVKVLIVEDEMIISHGIKLSLESSGYNVVGQAINYTESISLLESEKPDIAILDIKLSGGKSGIDLANEINKTFHIPFMFLTSNTDKLTVEEVKNVNPSAYLVKPFNEVEIATSIELALYNFSKAKETAFSQENLIIKDCLFVKVGTRFIRVNFSDIVLIKSSHVYVEIHLSNGEKHLVRGSLNEYINKVASTFFRSHRSYIVNLDYLQEILPNALVVLGNEIPVGKKNKEELLRLINKY
jgi:DNA-binding LytR/AlgR family response regulator